MYFAVCWSCLSATETVHGAENAKAEWRAGRCHSLNISPNPDVALNANGLHVLAKINERRRQLNAKFGRAVNSMISAPNPSQDGQAGNRVSAIRSEPHPTTD